MQTYNLCILGFGNVGRALAQLLLEKTAELRERYDIEWRLTGVATRRMGWIADPAGLDVVALLNGQIPDASGPGNVREWLASAQADVLFELTSTDPQTGQPAIDHLRAALERGAHAITANKGALIHAYPELRALAAAQGRRFLFEATVMAGGPVFSLFRDTLPAARLLRFRGLLNSTSNVIIEEMERGRSLEEAVQKAQELGIAETNPSLDVDGWDATLKVCAIATVLMDVPLRLEEIQREGIRGLSPEMVQQARAAGQPFKLVAQAERVGDGVVAYVRPEQLAPHDPLAAVSGGSMLAHFEMDVIPGLTITVHVPDTGMVGPAVTAYDVMADFIRATR
jgi:homoserine dehydrogenase